MYATVTPPSVQVSVHGKLLCPFGDKELYIGVIMPADGSVRGVERFQATSQPVYLFLQMQRWQFQEIAKILLD